MRCAFYAMISRFLLFTVSLSFFGTAPLQADWVDLLSGDSLELWESGSSTRKGVPAEIGEAWSLEDGVLHLDRSEDAEGKKKRGGFIVTKEDYFDFELTFDFLISHNGNSGVKYRTNNEGLGYEFQLIDDVHYRDNKNPTHRTGALYELAAADEEKKELGTAGEDWNSGRIVARGNFLEHWINGERMLSVEVGTEDWEERFEASKYRDIEGFGASAGAILLQDHGDNVSFRKVRIRRLDPPESDAASTPADPSATASAAAMAPIPGAPPAFLNCQACHLLNDVQVGPSLVEMAALYPTDNQEEFIEWCIKPGKKRPEMVQMPSMAHIPREQLAAIHDFLLQATEGVTAKRYRPKSDPYKEAPAATARPRIVRTFLPDAGPASLVVALPHPAKWNVVWDTSLCRLRYLSVGEPDNWPYLRSNGNNSAESGEVIYTERQIFDSDLPTSFSGYRLGEDRLPTFLYDVGDTEITETLSVSGDSLVRTFTSSGPLPVVDLLSETDGGLETVVDAEGQRLTIIHRAK